MFQRRNILKLVLFLGDVFLLYAAVLVAEVLRHGTLILAGIPDLQQILAHFTLLFGFWLLMLYILDFYEVPFLSFQKALKNFLAFLALALFSGVLYFYFRSGTGISPKTILALTIIIFGFLMTGWRLIFSGIFRIKEKDVLQHAARKVNPESVKEGEFFIAVGSVGKGYYFTKRLADIFSALLGFCLLAFLFPAAALAVKLTSPGPIFYSQKRVGQDGKIFVLHKFRTMVQDAEKSGPQWAREKDARITKPGLILRRTHLDELPQALNLLRGDVSLVGPRPERPEFTALLEKEIPHYRLRWVVKPGIMGWAQLNFPYGDSAEDAKEKLKYELYYILNRSLLFDLVIALKSLKIIIFAYGQ